MLVTIWDDVRVDEFTKYDSIAEFLAWLVSH